MGDKTAYYSFIYVCLAGPCDDSDDSNEAKEPCELLLEALESLDDECDTAGITLVTTEETDFAERSLGLKELPALVMFRNGDPLLFKGELDDEDEVWNIIMISKI